MQYLPKSDKILFTQQNGTYIMNPDGSQRRLLSTKNIPNSSKITQDEQTVYFVEVQTVDPKINLVLYTMSILTGEIKQVLQDSNGIGEFGISPDGARILYSSVSPRSDTTTLYLLGTGIPGKRIVKEWTNGLNCFYPQFVPNANRILFFEWAYGNNSEAYLRVMNLTDTSDNKILDTANCYYEYARPTINLNDDIFYSKNGITVLNVNTNQRWRISALFDINFDYINWSYDGTKIIFTENNSTQIVVYAMNDGSLTKIRPGEGDVNSMPYKFPFLNSNNSKIFFTIHFVETIYK